MINIYVPYRATPLLKASRGRILPDLRRNSIIICGTILQTGGRDAGNLVRVTDAPPPRDQPVAEGPPPGRWSARLRCPCRDRED